MRDSSFYVSMYINVLNYIPSQTDVLVFFAIWVQTCLFCFCKTQKVLHSAQILCNLYLHHIHLYHQKFTFTIAVRMPRNQTHMPKQVETDYHWLLSYLTKKQVLPLLAQAYWSSLWPQCTGWWVFSYWRQLVLTKPLFGNKWVPKLFPCKHYIYNINNRVSYFCIWVCVNVF